MNAIAPHGPVAQSPPEYQPPDIESGTAFDHFLPDNPPADTSASPDDDSQSDPEMSKTDSSRTSRGRDTKNAATDAATPDAAAMAAQLPSVADLRTMVPSVTLSPSLTPPTPAKQDGAAAQTRDGSTVNSSLAGAPGTKISGTTNAGIPPGTTTSPAKIALGMALNVPPPAPASVSATPGTTPNATKSAVTDTAAKATIGDSRLAAPAPAVEAQAKAADQSVKGAAKIAGSKRSDAGPVHSEEPLESEVTANQNFETGVNSGGTTVAKNVDVVTSTLSTSEKESEAGVAAKRGGSVSVATPSATRGGASAAPVSEMILGAAVTGAATVDASTAQVTASTTSGPTAASQAVKVETLLQNALSSGESVRPDGQGQMEMRVRLDGGAEDVTVRMQVTNDRMQVTFQTNSPELRKALEHGWQQFSATASQTSTLSLAQPRFETSQFEAGTGAPGDQPSFSSNQQDPRQQDAETTFAAGPSRAAAAPPSGATAAAAPAAGQSSGRRWSGWA